VTTGRLRLALTWAIPIEHVYLRRAILLYCTTRQSCGCFAARGKMT